MKFPAIAAIAFTIILGFAATLKAISVQDFFEGLIAQYGAENVVAEYHGGDHGIVGESGVYHEGLDLVIAKEKDCPLYFKQWFWGYSPTEGIHGEFSHWRMLQSPSDQCESNEHLVRDAYPEWGTYLEPGADYCVYTQDFDINGEYQSIVY